MLPVSRRQSRYLACGHETAPCEFRPFLQATGAEGIGESDDLLDLGVDSLLSVGISKVSYVVVVVVVCVVLS